MRRYNYKNHSEIPPYMADYITDVVGTVETVEEVPLNQIVILCPAVCYYNEIRNQLKSIRRTSQDY
jgi:hypothetical protein